VHPTPCLAAHDAATSLGKDRREARLRVTSVVSVRRRLPILEGVSPLDEAEFESLLAQVRDLHRRTDEITRSKSRLHEHIRSQLRWERNPPTVPSEQRILAERVVEILSKPRLSPGQARRLYETYFGRRGRA
jgi:hypothetical protein